MTVGPGTRGRDPRADLHALRAPHLDPGRGGGPGRARARTSSTTRTRSLAGPARSARRSVTIVCSPNNPTGGTLAREEVRSPLRGRRRPRRDRRGLPRVRGGVGRAAAGRAREPGRAAHVLEGDGAGRAARRLSPGLARARARDRQGAPALQHQLLLADGGAGRARGARRAGGDRRCACAACATRLFADAAAHAAGSGPIPRAPTSS